MSGVFKALGTVSGIVSSVLSFVPGMQPIAAAFAVNAAIMGTLGGLTAKKPVPVGSSTEITIGAKNPSAEIRGRCYAGGSRLLQVGYGSEDKIPNAYAGIVDVYSVGGPLQGLVGAYTDFTLQTFGGDDNNADGYYHNNLHIHWQNGLALEPAALGPHIHWPGVPDWGSDYKLSGKAGIFWSARFPAKGDNFRSGLPQLGAIWDGVLAWNPRADSTYPGGSGSQRWADPKNRSAFDAAKLTWVHSRNPGEHALRYALGTWERDMSNPASDYQLVFGMGIPLDGIVVADFVEFANVCDANGWKIDGITLEPGDRWENLKNIAAAGAAEPCIKGGRLGLRVTAPKVSLDTITRDDLADDEISVPATRSYRERLNTIIPKYKSADHKWEYVASSPVQVLEYVTADKEERSEERQYNMVAGTSAAATQVAQLAAYDLVEGRERWPIELSCKPRLRRYAPGDQLIVDLPEAGLHAVNCVIIRRTIDPATMKVSFTLREELTAKHAFALSRTGTSPPAISIAPPGDLDGAPSGIAGAAALQVAVATSFPIGLTITAADDGTVTISDHTRRYTDGHVDVAVEGDVIATGLTAGDFRAIGYDDEDRSGGTVTYQLFENDIDARASPAHPGRHYVGYFFVVTAGSPPGGGGGASPPGGNCVTIDTPIMMSDRTTKPAGDIVVGDLILTRHEAMLRSMGGGWGVYPVEAITIVDSEDVWEATIGGRLLRATGDHLVYTGSWIKIRDVGTLIGAGQVVKMTVTGAHTYVSNGVLSHNIKENQPSDL